MQLDEVCFPAPLGCFPLSESLPGAVEEEEAEDSPEELLFGDAWFEEQLRAEDPEGCFLCEAERLGDED